MLDLFAGTGALGIEAVSRGAAYALFVDDGAEARALLRDNIETLGLWRCHPNLPPRRQESRPGRTGREPFSLAFIGPPYGRKPAEKARTRCAMAAGLTPGALVVVEEQSSRPFAGFESSRRSWITVFTFCGFG